VDFEWDPAKASRNRVKHGIDFSEAATVFDDVLSQTFEDLDHSDDARARIMKKTKDHCEDELREEYDSALIRKGVRGKYAAKYNRGTNLILLEPDVATAFPTAESVNDALRLLMKVAGSVRKNQASK
jgi:hypothetical protein